MWPLESGAWLALGSFEVSPRTEIDPNKPLDSARGYNKNRQFIPFPSGSSQVGEGW